MTVRPTPPGPGQESVWAYPRPPSLAPSSRRIEIVLGGRTIVDTTRSWRVCETSHPPVHYVAPEDFAPGLLTPGNGSSYCEFKGAATYWNVGAVPDAGWSYERPTPAFVALRGAIAVYPGRVDEIRLDGEVVTPQAGGFYGGWITSAVVGPFKGEPGTWGW